MTETWGISASKKINANDTTRESVLGEVIEKKIVREE
jgi:hypothetical protein